MAGSGKISPRQKMINMMYLVLLALLAMNISKEVLDSFDNLRLKLGESASTAQTANGDFVESMKAAIEEEMNNENKDVNKGLLDTLPQLNIETQKIISMLDNYIDTVKRMGKYDPATQKMEKLDEIDANWKYFIGKGDQELANEVQGFGPRGSGEAFEFRNAYKAYVDYVVDMYNSQVRAGDSTGGQKINAEEYYLKDYEAAVKEHNETWEVKSFKGPVIANWALLEALKIDAYKLEQKLLDKFNERLGVAKFKIDKFTPIVAPEATIVPAGLQFRAKLYLTLSSSQIKPSFAGNGVKTDATGDFAELTLPASGTVIPKGKNEGTQRYSANIGLKTTSGAIENYPVEGTFTVRKPEIVITSAAVQNLYRSCGNTVNIDVPALGDYYNPDIKVSSGSVQKSKESKKKFMIMPEGRKCDVSVNSITNGRSVNIGVVNYKVIEPPKPSIEMMVNGKPYNGSSPIPKTSRILVKVKPDAEFRAALPNDARYGISTIDVLGQLSLGPPRNVGTVRGGRAEKGIRVSLPTEIRQARPGTKVYVRVNEVYRLNFRNQRKADGRFSELERTLSLVTR